MRLYEPTVLILCLLTIILWPVSAGNACGLEDTACLKAEMGEETNLRDTFKETAQRAISDISDPIMSRTLTSVFVNCSAKENPDEEDAASNDAHEENLSSEPGEIKNEGRCYQDILFNHFIVDRSVKELIRTVEDLIRTENSGEK